MTDSMVGPLIGAAIAIGGGLIGHMISDAFKQGRMESDIQHIKEQIGTHDSGIRGELHRQVNLLGRLRSVVYFIGRKLGLEVMKDLDDE